MFSLEYFVVVECRGWINRKSTHNCGLGKVKKNNGIFHLGSLTHPPPYGPLIFWVGMVKKYVDFYINSSHIRTFLKFSTHPLKRKIPLTFKLFWNIPLVRGRDLTILSRITTFLHQSQCSLFSQNTQKPRTVHPALYCCLV